MQPLCVTPVSAALANRTGIQTFQNCTQNIFRARDTFNLMRIEKFSHLIY